MVEEERCLPKNSFTKFKKSLEHYFLRSKELEAQIAQVKLHSGSDEATGNIKATIKNKNAESRFSPLMVKLKNSGYFSHTWYLEQYPDIVESGMDPVEHYLRFRGFEGRDPGPFFDSKWYLEKNPDVRATGMNPLLHFVEHGQREGQEAKP